MSDLKAIKHNWHVHNFELEALLISFIRIIGVIRALQTTDKVGILNRKLNKSHTNI